jgi:hypothetical protein
MHPMRDFHAKGVIFTRFAIPKSPKSSIYAAFQPKITLASTLLLRLLKDVDSVDGQQ